MPCKKKMENDITGVEQTLKKNFPFFPECNVQNKKQIFNKNQNKNKRGYEQGMAGLEVVTWLMVFFFIIGATLKIHQHYEKANIKIIKDFKNEWNSMEKK